MTAVGSQHSNAPSLPVYSTYWPNAIFAVCATSSSHSSVVDFGCLSFSNKSPALISLHNQLSFKTHAATRAACFGRASEIRFISSISYDGCINTTREPMQLTAFQHKYRRQGQDLTEANHAKINGTFCDFSFCFKWFFFWQTHLPKGQMCVDRQTKHVESDKL